VVTNLTYLQRGLKKNCGQQRPAAIRLHPGGPKTELPQPPGRPCCFFANVKTRCVLLLERRERCFYCIIKILENKIPSNPAAGVRQLPPANARGSASRRYQGALGIVISK